MKTTTSPPKHTTFSIQAPNAKEVFVAGTFNNWNPKTHPMRRDADGRWTLRLPLAPARYEYKFIVDNWWCCDLGCDGPYNGCPGCVPNSVGTMNRVLEVA